MKPRWLGLLALVVVVMVTFGILGLWQLNVARDKGRAEAVKAAPTRPTAALSRVVTPHADFPADGSGRPVTATGRYDATGQVLVTPRLLHGRTGYWVVTPLVVKDTGARLAVVRGFVTDAARATPTGGHRPGHGQRHARAGGVAQHRGGAAGGAAGLGRPLAAGEPLARRDLQRVPLRHG